ncbi:hypothetical protein, partial [Pseudomonas cannabina]|uniref:hypothetical protein n=1 Tax=Pseudomonas cannabina TaxID=86840 RepID=UPI001C801D15
KSFLPTSTPRWHRAEGTFFGGLPCIGIIEIPMQQGHSPSETRDLPPADIAFRTIFSEFCELPFKRWV